MSEYKATSVDSLSFDLVKDDNLVGKLRYISWFKFNASIELADNYKYEVEPKGFWGTTIEVKAEKDVLLQFSMSWKGHIIIETSSPDSAKGYVLKHKGVFKESFVLSDDQGTELLNMKPDFKWKKMLYEYHIITNDHFEALPNKDLLLMISIHCANYFIAMMMSSGY